MSFLGLPNKQKYEYDQSCVQKEEFFSTSFFYEDDVQIFETEDYKLFVIGNIVLDNSILSIEKALEAAKGTFCYVLMQRDELIVGTDVMGFYPLYYIDGPSFSFANFIPHLKHRMKTPKINWDTWNELLNGGDIIGNKTTIKGVFRLGQGEKIRYKKEAVAINSFDVYAPALSTHCDDYIKENNELLTESIKILSNHSKKLTIPLTGGHDSRRIALTASNLNLNYSAITQETNVIGGYDVDSFVAAQLTDILDIKKHNILVMPDENSIKYHRALKDYWCGFESAQHEWATNISSTLEANSLIFDGIIGDVTINNHYFHSHPDLLANYKNINKVLSYITPKPLFSIKPHLLENSIEQSLFDGLAKFDNDPNQLTLFKVFNHTRRNIGHWFTMFLHDGHDVALPFGDLNFFNQSLSLAPSERLNALYQKKCMLAVSAKVANLHSTRDSHTAAYWKELGAKKVRQSKPLYQADITKIDRKILSNFETTYKSFLIDRVAYALSPQKVMQAQPWKYLPLQRLALFLEWLDTDESGMPILFKGHPVFLDKILH